MISKIRNKSKQNEGTYYDFVERNLWTYYDTYDNKHQLMTLCQCINGNSSSLRQSKVGSNERAIRSLVDGEDGAWVIIK